MFNPRHSHPLLAQVPLTLSPFIQIPSAVTLPYTFRSVPTSLPPSITDKPQYITSPSGHAAHPDDIIKSCQALEAHIAQTSADAKKAIADWEQGIKERELAEKRRVAPGYLDREEKILLPTASRAKTSVTEDLLGHTADAGGRLGPAMSPDREGEEIDRAFGRLDVKK